MTSGKQTKQDERLLVRYLLGTLSDAERDELETRYFSEAALLELLLATENELIEDYTDGRLSADERRNFEQYYLRTPEKRSRVNLVNQLRKSAFELAAESRRGDERKQSRASWWQNLQSFLSPQSSTARLAVGFGSLVIVFGVIWLAYQNQNLRSRIRLQDQAEVALKGERRELERQLAAQRSQNEELTLDLRQTEVERRGLEEQLSEQVAVDGQPLVERAVIPSIDLGGGRISDPGLGMASPGSRRPISLRVPRAARFIQVRVPVNRTGHRSYVLSLRDRSDNEVWGRTELKPRTIGARQVIDILIPASLVRSGSYTIVLLGEKDQGTTEFIAAYPIKAQVQ